MESPEIERLRRQMLRIRERLDDDVDGIRDHARQLLDWKYYVRRYPWTCLGGATLLGFWLMPKSRRPEQRISLDENATRELLQSRDGRELEISSRAAAPGLLKSVTLMAGSTLLRAGISYLGKQMTQGLEQASDDPDRVRTRVH